jgi:hypothetical protein
LFVLSLDLHTGNKTAFEFKSKKIFIDIQNDEVKNEQDSLGALLFFSVLFFLFFSFSVTVIKPVNDQCHRVEGASVDASGKQSIGLFFIDQDSFLLTGKTKTIC